MRSHKIMIRVSLAEMQKFEEAAEKKGLKVASWSRMNLLDRIREDEAAAAISTQDKKSHELLSVFCGPGGLDEGFAQAGFSTRVAFDIDQECVNTFNRNHAKTGVKAHKRDIRELTAKDVISLAGEDFRPIGVIGGPPCQSFSVSNVHQYDEDPRHKLPEAYARLLKEMNERNPLSFFVFENVPGILGKRHKERYEHFKTLFGQCGFQLYENLLDAKDFGVAQERPRVIVVGINKTLHSTVKWEPPQSKSGTMTVRSAIADLPEPVHNSSEAVPETFPVHPNHWCPVPRSAKFSRAGSLVEGQAWGRSFRTLAWDKPSWTVAYGHREVHVHPNGRRRLSIYEAMLLQSFPKTYRLTGNMSAQIRLVSEAVPPMMAYHVALAVRRCIGI